MQYYSTNLLTPPTTFHNAVIEGLAKDKGLFMPEVIPALPDSFFQRLPEMTLPQIAKEIALPFIGDELLKEDLSLIIEEALNFDIPLVQINENVHILELFHGPTAAFKDVGARFMSRVMAHLLQGVGKKVYVLVATSGDTGSAVAQGFYKVPGIDVVILYPSGKVSKVQEMQFCTLGENITALEVDGTFDDCQRLVKTAFADSKLREKLYLTSANSINIARLLPQSFYYFYAYAQLRRTSSEPVVFSVPSGNYGNLTAGLLAWQMGLPVHQFLAASNANDTVPLYLNGKPYVPKPSVATMSNAMDVGDPSNFARMRVLFDDSLQKMQQHISGYSLTDEQTQQAMQEVYEQYNYIIDPHGAVAYKAFQLYQGQEKQQVQGIVLGTAHPAKFGEVVKETLHIEPPMPAQLAECLHREKKSIPTKADFEELKAFFLQKI